MNWLKEIRKEAGLTQGRLAEIACLERSLISKFETGRARPSPDTAKLIAKILGFDWTKFYEDISS